MHLGGNSGFPGVNIGNSIDSYELFPNFIFAAHATIFYYTSNGGFHSK